MNPRRQSTVLAWLAILVAVSCLLIGEPLFALGFALFGIAWLACLYWEDRRHRQMVQAERAARLQERREEAEYRMDEAA